MANLIGQQFGQYVISALLGKGGMATVYRARQTSINRDVALKVIKPDLATTEEFILRFEREAQTIATMSHPHVLKVFDYGRQGDMVYLVMELLTGGSLSDLIRQSGALPLPVTVRLMDQVGQALDYAHRRGIVHRDLKPQNVLLDENGNAFLTDFGIAKLLTETSALTQSGMAMGTPAYMAPEQWRGLPIDGRSDVYALGVMLFEMLTGRLPFSGDTPFSMMHMHVYDAPPAIHDIRPDLPAALGDVMARALAKERDNRYASAGELAADLRAVLGGEAPAASRSVPASADDLTSAVPAAMVGAPSTPRFSQGMASTPPGATPLGLEAEDEPRARSRMPLLVGAIGLIAVAAIALVLLAGGPGAPGAETPAPTQTEGPPIAQVASETPSPSLTPTLTATATPTPAATDAPTESPSDTPSPAIVTDEPALSTATPEPPTAVAQAVPTDVPASPTATATQTSEPPSATPEPSTVTPSETPGPPTAVAQIGFTETPEPPTVTATEPPLVQVIVTDTPEPPTATATEPPLVQVISTATPTPTETPAETPTPTPSDTPTATPSPTPTPTSTATDTPTATFTPTFTDTPTATPTDTPTATFTPTFTATFTETPTPTFTPSPTLTPTAVPPQGMIAFHTELNGAWSINAISPDGTNLRRISDARGDTYTPALSPDGRRLAFVSRRDSGNPDIWIMDVGSNTAQRITRNPAEDWGPAWSPDGRLLAFHSNRERNYELYVVDPVELVARRLTYTGPRIDNADASWSPDGREILFASNRDSGGLFIIGADGTGERRLTPPGYLGHDPAWSPDGSMIAYQARRSNDADDWQIFVMDIDKLEPRQLTFVGSNERAAWSPDGRYIAFQSNRDGKQEIYLIGVDGSGERRVTSSPGNNGWPTWALDPDAPPVATSPIAAPPVVAPPVVAPPVVASPVVAPPAGAMAVTSVVVIVNPESVTGPCPQTFLYTAAITVSAPGAILYQWEIRDGTTTAPTALVFPADQLTQTVSQQATYDQSGTFYHLLRVLAPVLYTSDRATATLTCSP